MSLTQRIKFTPGYGKEPLVIEVPGEIDIGSLYEFEAEQLYRLFRAVLPSGTYERLAKKMAEEQTK